MHNPKTLNFILHLVDNMATPTETNITKVCFLCDLASVKTGGSQITNFSYTNSYYGPAADGMRQALDKLVNDGELEYRIEYTSEGGEFVEYSIPTENQGSASFTENLSDHESEIASEILKSVGNLNAQALTNISKATTPMKRNHLQLNDKVNLTVPASAAR